MPFIRGTSCLFGLLASAAIAATATSANAAFSYAITADNSTQSTTFVGFVTPPPVNLGPLYTTFGAPAVTNAGGLITFNFDASISPNFKASAGGFVIGQTTDGHLVINLHFDTPTSITASIFEAGVYSKVNPGAVAVSGGEVAIEAVNPSPTESHSASLTATFDGAGGWTGTATTAPFVGFFTDYQISIDNQLDASAFPSGSASIFKKDFILQINTGGSGQPPAPEPASLGILAVGALGLIARRRR